MKVSGTATSKNTTCNKGMHGGGGVRISGAVAVISEDQFDRCEGFGKSDEIIPG